VPLSKHLSVHTKVGFDDYDLRILEAQRSTRIHAILVGKGVTGVGIARKRASRAFVVTPDVVGAGSRISRR
jgi:hypothetical protein